MAAPRDIAAQVQRNWMYLQPIFESPDINKQLPAEGKKFATVNKNWCATVTAAKARPVPTQCFSRNFSELEVRVDGVNATPRHRDAVDVAVRAFLPHRASACPTSSSATPWRCCARLK